MTTQVLFVDDEPNVLSGLRRMLRSQRQHWTMHFAGNGQEALDLMQNQSIDVIVSDMRMPGMDGAELLTNVAKTHPDTVRLVLSGQSEHERILRAIGPAHQFMSKPCDPEVLIETIGGACGLQSRLNAKILQQVISRIGALPSLPKLYSDLVLELDSNDPSIDRVGETIGADLAMSAKVLQLVNSSFFGLPQHVTCPKHAVSLLGLGIIRPLTLIAGAFAQYEDADQPGFSLEDEVGHGLSVATSAQKIAMLHSPDDAYLIDDALIAGMMHDIGKLILIAQLPDQYNEAIELSNSGSVSNLDAEREVFGTTHAEVGAHLLNLWGLSNSIVEAVAFHHCPSESLGGRFSALTAVHVANSLSRSDDSIEDFDSIDSIDHDYLNRIGVENQLDGWKQHLAQESAV